MTNDENLSGSGEAQDFKSAFCARFGCRPRQFERKLFREIFNPEMRMVATIIRCVYPRFFSRDWEYIRRVGEAKDKRDVLAVANRMPFDPHFTQGLLRGFLRIRISSSRLTRIAHEVL